MLATHSIAVLEVPVIAGWREPRCLAERGGERAGLAESDRQSDVGHGELRLGQEHLGLLDTSAIVISVRRHSKGLLERAAEIVRAQTNETRERGEWYLLGKMFLDIRGGDPLLPAREAAPHRSFHRTDPGVETHELVCQDETESLDIESIVGAGTLDPLTQLDRRIP